MFIVLGLILFLIGLLAYVLFIYNKIMNIKQEAETFWLKIQVQFKQRAAFIPVLFNAANGVLQHEAEVLNALKKINHYYPTLEKKLNAQRILSISLQELLDRATDYLDLKNNPVFLSKHKMLVDLQKEHALCCAEYNQQAQRFNRLIGLFPNNLIAIVFQLKKLIIFEQKN